MRFKPPPSNSPIGWRVEFRPCELQIDDFENAAVVCFVVLLTRVLLSYGYNILVPISKVDDNMKRAQKMDAILNEKFYFRTNITATCNSDTDEKKPIIEGEVNRSLICVRIAVFGVLLFHSKFVLNEYKIDLL